MSKKKTVTKTQADKVCATVKDVVISQPSQGQVGLEVHGITPLIQNAFSQKAIEEMLRKHMGISQQREKKNPRAVVEGAIVRNINDLVVVPVIAFKAAMITASAQIKTFEKKGRLLRTTVYIEGAAAPIKFEKMSPRMDMVRTSGMSRTPDVRFRPQFDGWSARLIITYNDTLWNVQSLVDLLNRAGDVGVGEWRPEKMGTFGKFRVSRHISDPKEVREVIEQCSTPLKTPTVPEWAMDMGIDFELMQEIMTGGDKASAMHNGLASHDEQQL